jgi:hypothetical protein
MVDKILEPEEGITYGLFQDDENEEAAEEEPEEPEEEEEDEDGEKKPVPPPVEKLPKHIIIDEVVREPRMHFYRVPKLGSYLAVKMEYQSCLFEEAFGAAVEDYEDVKRRKVEQ